MKNDPQMSSALAASQDSDDELDDCPICVEPFDESDRLFLPCQCNYQVCMFCVRRLMTEFDGRCPGCRSVYNEANFRIREMDPEEVEKRKQREKQKNLERARQQQMKNSSNSAQAGNAPSGTQSKLVRQGSAGAITSTSGAPPGKRPVGPPPGTHLSPLGGPQSGNGPNQGGEHSEAALAQQRKNLATVRVVQHHVVFVLGLPMSLAKEEILRRPEHFGQYGPIVKIVVGHPASAPGRTASASAHITFQRVEDAREAIRGVDGIVLDGHQIRASFGTTRYCHAFLRGQQCHNPECLFLHQEVDPSAQTMPNPQTTSTGSNANATGTSQTNGNGTAAHTRTAVVTTAGNASGGEAKTHVAPAGTFGGTDPFAVENIPEPLNGIDLAQFEKQKANSKTTSVLTKGRTPGSERPQPATLPPQAPSYDCTLSFIADLVAGRTVMPDDLRRKMLWLAGPRAKSSQFSGLGCILSDVNPLFVAPLGAPVELKDVPGTEHVVQSALSTTLPSGKDEGANNSNSGSNNPAQQTQQSTQDTAKDKKLSRKNKKAAFAAQNRIGGEEGF